MSELRKDPIHQRWVIIAPERARRPVRLAPEEPSPSTFCPFCPGNEHACPPEIVAVRPPGFGREDLEWKVRVVPNRFPALRVEGELEPGGNGVYDRMNGIGAHEVVIESRHHDLHMADMDYRSVERVVQVWLDRQRDLFRDGRLEHVLVFKNHGLPAGAPLAHAHSQIIATPVTPVAAAARLDSARRYWEEKRRCVFCDMLEQEVRQGVRVVWSDAHLVVLAPYASRFPFELLVLPRRHDHSFVNVTPDEATALARVLRDSLRRLREALDDPPYNLVLHTAPNPVTHRPHAFGGPHLAWSYHWHIEVIPRLVPVAGFEWGSGFYINPTPPEEAASYLRQVEP